MKGKYLFMPAAKPLGFGVFVAIIGMNDPLMMWTGVAIAILSIATATVVGIARYFGDKTNHQGQDN